MKAICLHGDVMMSCSTRSVWTTISQLRFIDYVSQCAQLQRGRRRSMADNEFPLPSAAQKAVLTKAFIKDLESFTVFDKKSNLFVPVVCCVCDSIPTKGNWSCFVDIDVAADLFRKSNMMASVLTKLKLYPLKLVNQYSINCHKLKSFILSPASYINDLDQILMCKQCHSDLLQTGKKYVVRNKDIYLPPVQSQMVISLVKHRLN